MDGHNRFRICQELIVETTFNVRDLGDSLKEKLFVIESNLIRRQLNSIKRIELAYKLEPIYAELARERKLASLRQNSSSVQNYTDGEKGRVIEKCAKIAQVSPSLYHQGRYVIKTASDEIKRELRLGTRSINETYRLIKEQERKRSTEDAQKSELQIPKEGIQIYQADFREKIGLIPDESIDLMFTNCSHCDSFLQRDVMQFATRILRRERYFVVYTNKNQIQTIMQAARGAGLSYRWLIVTTNKKSPYLANLYGFDEHCRIMLIFSKGLPTLKGQRISDLIEGPNGAPSSDSFDATQIVSSFSIEGEIICDPFLDYSRAIASLELKRKMIGFVASQEGYEITKSMLDICRSRITSR